MLRNPALARELVLIGRSARTPLALAAAAAIVAAVALLPLAGTGVGAGAPAGLAEAGLPVQTGGRLFSLIAAAQMALVVAIAPALTAGAVSGEREGRTLEVVLRTRVSPAAFVAGKLLAAALHLLLLLVAAAPATGVLSLVGGVPLAQVVRVSGVLLATAVLLAAVGICASAFSRRTASAALAAYLITAALVAGTLLPGWLAGDRRAASGIPPQALSWLASANPAVALAATTGGPIFTPVLAAALGPAPGDPAAGASAPAGADEARAAGPAAFDALRGGWLPPAYAALMSGGPGAPAAGGRVVPPAPFLYQRYLALAGAAAVLLVAAAAVAIRLPGGAGWRPVLGLAPAGRPRSPVGNGAVAARGGGDAGPSAGDAAESDGRGGGGIG